MKSILKVWLEIIALAVVGMLAFVVVAQATQTISFTLLKTECEDDYWAGKENMIYDYNHISALGLDDQYWDWWGFDKSFTGYRRYSEVSFDCAHDWDPEAWNCGGSGTGCSCDQEYYFKGLPSDGTFILQIKDDNSLSYSDVDILSYALPPGKKAPNGAILEQLSDFPDWATEGHPGSSGTYNPDTNYFTAQINLNIDFKQTQNQNAWIENSHQFGYIIPKEEFGNLSGGKYPIPIYEYDPNGGGTSFCGDEPFSGTPNAGKYPGEYVQIGTLDLEDDGGWLSKIVSLPEVADADYLYIGIQRDNFLRDETCVRGKHPNDGGNLYAIDVVEWPILSKDFLNYEGVWVAVGYIGEAVAKPVFSPDPGQYYPHVEVEISCDTPGATIYYTTDGSDPTESSNEYTEPITITTTTTLKARAFKKGQTPSSIATARYIIDDTVKKPVFTPSPGEYPEPQQVFIVSDTPGATIYYTTDGSDPTESSNKYTDLINITTTTTLKARAFKEGLNPSEITTGTYTILGANEPLADIKVNGSDGPVTLNPSDTLNLSVSLNNNDITDDADWWLAADTPSGLYFFTFDGWTTDWSPGYQGPLFYLDSFEVLNDTLTAALPTSTPGTYTLYFGVDTVRDGDVTWDSVYYDTVVVNVTE